MKRYRVNSPKVIGQVIDGEAVIINLETGFYYSLNQTGALVWDRLASEPGVAELTAYLRQECRSGEEETASAVTDLLAQLIEEELLVEFDGAQGTALFASDAMKDGRDLPLPVLSKYTDMTDLLLLDPIHGVDESGWPVKKVDPPEPLLEPAKGTPMKGRK